jgi:hydroxypyruvate isomerase
MSKMNRRDALQGLGAAAVGAFVLPKFARTATIDKIVKKGRLKQSVSYWCYQGKYKLPEFARIVSGMGLTAIDLLTEEQWPVVREQGLICSMGYPAEGAQIPKGLNDKANHEIILRGLTRSLPVAAKMKVPNLIAFFGNRGHISDAEAFDNCVAGLNQIKKMAEDNNVTICVELLNSKVDHKDYLGDHAAFGVKVIQAVNSPRVKLLYDIYHMQIMDGDIIRTIRDNHQYIGHFHTGGVPGRHELDDSQELNWATVCRAIVDTGYTGYVAHEFVPTRDPLQSLGEAIALCDV